MQEHLKTYGKVVHSKQLKVLLEYSLQQNDKLTRRGKRGIPICIWGTHGIGKTESIISFAKENNWTYVYCAPAQFEEMGDLHGIPETYDPTPETPNSGDEYTVYRPPQWLKNAISNLEEDKPGLLILDDFNRADNRIIQGCMQLLQMHALFSWSLPPRWQIVLTANPEGGPYAVTEMDDAMLTRMLHVTLEFDVEVWATWAISHGIDTRGIDFLLTYPEVITGVRTTARSLTQFFYQIEGLDDLGNPENLTLMETLGLGTLEEETVAKFLHFCKFIQHTLIQPLEILETKNFTQDVSIRLSRIVTGDGQGKRTDRLQTICTRLILFVMSDAYEYKKGHEDNLIAFLISEEMESTIRFNTYTRILNIKRGEGRKLYRAVTKAKNPKLGQLINESL